MTDAELQAIEDRANAATDGPWDVWRGPQYVGGGEDLCIGRGDEWLANMDHREPRCAQISDDGHFDSNCNICTVDSEPISVEQKANADFIAHARTDVPALVAEVRRLRALLVEAHTKGLVDDLADIAADLYLKGEIK